MAEAANQVQHEFWRPPMAASTVVSVPVRSSTCRCGTEFIVSSLYCHSCGVSRPDLNATRALELPGLAELALLGQRLGLRAASLVAFLFGMFCIVGALAVSVFFTARTLSDWQAIQLWRIEWLLAAVASFAVGCLLKK